MRSPPHSRFLTGGLVLSPAAFSFVTWIPKCGIMLQQKEMLHGENSKLSQALGMSWTYRMRGWEPLYRGSRPVGRPAARWEDTLNRFASTRGIKWTETAKDRNQWKSLEDEFVTFGS